MRQLAVAVAVIAALLAGLWIAAGLIAPTYLTSIVAAVVWFIAASMILGRLRRRRPDLSLPLRGAFLTTVIAVAAVGAWTSLRDDTVDEDVVTAAPATAAPSPAPAAKPRNLELARGEFQVADEGSAKGTARLIKLARGGRKLTLTGFAVNNGPDLRVYLVPGDGKDTGDHKDLGALKGNKGDQQYDVPDAVDTARYRTVVIWCRAFSVAFARAPLSAE